MDESLQNFDKNSFAHHLSVWYKKHHRQLPWRETNDPYRIWVSEIMLQQTKVDTVIAYYQAFMKKFPTVFALASAEEEEVLKMWEGLGYYSRARNLHAAAKEVVDQFNGVMPSGSKQLGALKGIGPYTEGAILSIAFNQAAPAVDGNVMRVLSRVLYIEDNISDQKTRKRFEAIVQTLIQEANPSVFNQGLMELGALICSPKKPLCLDCPVNTMCRAHELGDTGRLPLKLKKKKQRIEKYVVLVLQDESGKVAIEKRPKTGLLANMWQFPMIERTLFDTGQLEQQMLEKYLAHIELGNHIQTIKHVFTHIIWQLDVYHATYQGEAESQLRFVTYEELGDYPISVSHQKIIQQLQVSME